MSDKKDNLNLKNYKKIRTPFVFFDETGSINNKANRFFGLGMVKCMQPYFLDNKIRLLRQKYQFFEEIKWNKVSKKKIKFLKDLVDITFETPGIYFSSIIINKNNMDFEQEFQNDPYKAYQAFTEILLKKSIAKNEVLTVLADYISTPHKIKFEVDVKHNINQELGRLAIAGVHRVDSKGLNLIQMADFFLGAVVYEHKKKNKLVSGDQNKIKMYRYLLNKLQRSTFTNQFRTRRFTVLKYK